MQPFFKELDDEQLSQFLIDIPWIDLEKLAAPFFGKSNGATNLFLKSLQSEAILGFQLILPYLKPGQRVLEIGSGMGLLAAFLSTKGVDITALEPGLGGFSVSASLAKAVENHPNFKVLRRLDKPAQQLSEANEGKFDLIYSVNVLEHIPEIEVAIQSMKTVLSEQGRMVHTCPNYTVPYEPHFGIPLVPVFPKLTAVLSSNLKNSDLWNSLNFITTAQVKDLCKRQALYVAFKRELMYNSFLRLEKDLEFSKRQSNSWVSGIYKILRSTRILKIIRYVPPEFSTPMTFEIKHNLNSL